MHATFRLVLTWPLCFLASAAIAGETQAPLAKQLQPFASYLGKTFKGEFASSTPEKPAYDVQKWERALNGQGIRILHSVNDGQYGGESIIMWDPKEEKVSFWYFTTAGFHTHGTMTFEDGKWIGHEAVIGSQEGISEVKSTTETLPDGRMHAKSQYLKEGKWVDGHEIFYKEAPAAEVKFK